MNDSKHLQAEQSDRGFSRLPEIPGAANHYQIRP